MPRFQPSAKTPDQQFDVTDHSSLAESFIAGCQGKLASHRQFEVRGVINRQSVFIRQFGDSSQGEARAIVVHYERNLRRIRPSRASFFNGILDFQVSQRLNPAAFGHKRTARTKCRHSLPGYAPSLFFPRSLIEPRPFHVG
jgi:hypothetical protein